MISLILGEWLWINTFIGMILYSSTRRICNRVNWQLENEIGSIDGCFIYTTCRDQSKTWDLIGLQLIQIAHWKAFFS